MLKIINYETTYHKLHQYFIETAEDCPISQSEIPPEKKVKSLAKLQFEYLTKKPYQYTSDELLFECHVIKNDIPESEKEEEKLSYFQKVNRVFGRHLWQKDMALDFIIIWKVKLRFILWKAKNIKYY